MFLFIKLLSLLLFITFYAQGFEVYKSVQNVVKREVPSQDVDSDGIPDYMDECPDTFLNAKINEKGCPLAALIVLLPNHKAHNAIVVENDMGSVEVDKPYMSVKMSEDEEPSEPKKISKKDLENQFPFMGENRYKKAKQYTLYFQGMELKNASKLKLKDIIDDIRGRSNPIIEISGYTDTIGKKDKNLLLSQKRAKKIHDILLDKELDILKIISHGYGEENLKIQTKDGVAEPRNRRVEILIK